MKIRCSHTVNNITTIHEAEMLAWSMDDIAIHIPEEMILRVAQVDPLAVQRLDKETRTCRHDTPAKMISADVMESYFRKWHGLGAITDAELDWLLNGTVG